MAIFLGVTLTSPAWAALGDNEQSVQRDAVLMRGVRNVQATTSYSVHEIQAPSGYTVREYVSPGGTVFAVSWSGPGGIDLQSLLGTYFEQFQQNAQAQSPPARRPLMLSTPDLVFEQSGHMRAIRGRAYIPALLPANVDPNQIQ